MYDDIGMYPSKSSEIVLNAWDDEWVKACESLVVCK